MHRLIGDVALSHAGQTIVVMGGGPSLPEAMRQVRRPDVLISANEHGAMLGPVDYIVSVDHTHQRLKMPMREVLAQYPARTISPCLWADYRIPDYRSRGNAGMNAMWVAWVLGAWPLVVAGIDCYQGATYYHDAEAESSSNGRPLEKFDEKLEALRAELNCPVRIVGDGPLTRFWPRYDPNEAFGPFEPSATASALRDMEPVLARVLALRFVHHGPIQRGEFAVLSPNEFQAWSRQYACVRSQAVTLEQLRAAA